VSASTTTMWGIIHGKTIELEQEPGLPDGLKVSVQLRAEEPPPPWLERFTVDPAIAVGKLLVRGTRLVADDLVHLVEEGRSDDDLRQLHPELAAEDLDAVRQYAQVPAGLRRAFGGWAEDADELDRYLQWNRQQRDVNRPELAP
jgi:uncharacterized protein (DUF433 family)